MEETRAGRKLLIKRFGARFEIPQARARAWAPILNSKRERERVMARGKTYDVMYISLGTFPSPPPSLSLSLSLSLCSKASQED